MRDRGGEEEGRGWKRKEGIGCEEGGSGKDGLTAHDDRHSAIRSHRHEKERRVLQVVVIVLGEQDRKAGDRNTDWDESKEEAVAEEVGEVRN